MKGWMQRAEELLQVIGRRPLRRMVTSEIRDNLRDVLARAEQANYVIMHYREPRAVLTHVETFEAMRQLTLLVSGLLSEREAAPELETTTLPDAAWKE